MTSFLAIYSVIVVASVGMFFLSATQVVLMFVLYGLVQFLVQMMRAAIIFMMTADTVEYGELKEGRRITGMVFSGTFFFLKLGVAFGGAALGVGAGGVWIRRGRRDRAVGCQIPR